MTDIKRPASPEEEYFAREQAEKLRKLALQRQKELAEAERKQLRELHYMHCPKCGSELHTISFRGIDIDHCFACGGNWLDQGELEKIAAKEGGTVTQAILNLFKGK